MGLCKNCRYGETRKGIIFKNYWCNIKNAVYCDNLSSCRNYAPKGETCSSCKYFEGYESRCTSCDKLVNRTCAACSNFIRR